MYRNDNEGDARCACIGSSSKRKGANTTECYGLADCCANAFSFLNILYIENEDVSKCLFFFRMYIGYKPTR